MALRTPWPGWTRQQTLLLPVPPGAWPPPAAPVTVDGIVLRPKRELHVTLVGRRLGRELQQAAHARRIAGTAVRAAFGELDWHWDRPGCRSLLRAPPETDTRGPRHAVVEHIALPAMARFHAALGALLGRALPVPPPHVTLYVAGTTRGIGLPDAATLARYRVRDLRPGEAGAFTQDTRDGAEAGRPR